MLIKGTEFVFVIALIFLRNGKGLKVTCDTEFSDLKHSITQISCPANCWRQHSTLCGDRIYSRGPICLAAMQDQWIDGGGGPVVVFRSPGRRNHLFSGGKRNAVSSESCLDDGPSYSFEMRCATQGDSSTPITTVVCPAYCKGEAVYGSGIYNYKSSVCRAAVHAGMLPDEGGLVTFYAAKGQSSYNGSTSSGVKSKLASSSKAAFAFTNIDECSSNTCKHGSSCIDGIGEYFCVCTPGYRGKYCEIDIDECSNNTCKHGSSCVDGIGEYICVCTPGYRGKYCEIDIDECSNNTCKYGSSCIDGIGEYICVCTPGYRGKYCEIEFTHCWDGNLTGKFVQKSGDEVVCDNGWLVFQRRFDGSVDFQVYWSDYRNGFGRLNGEFWWGLENIHKATKGFQCHQCRLRVELKDIEGETSYAEYSRFGVGSESSGYVLCVGGYTGTAGDSIVTKHSYANSNGVKFSTRDRDNDEHWFVHCAEFSRRAGGWWIRACSFAVPNGSWKPPLQCPHCRAHWTTLKNSIPLTDTELKFRCGI